MRHILSPSGSMLKADQSALNKFLNEAAERLVTNNPANYDVIMSYIDLLKIVLTVSNFELQLSMKC